MPSEAGSQRAENQVLPPFKSQDSRVGEGKIKVDIYERGGAVGKIQTPGTSRAKHDNMSGEARKVAGLGITHWLKQSQKRSGAGQPQRQAPRGRTRVHGARVGKPGVLTSRNLLSGSEPQPGQDTRGASESRERRTRTQSLTHRTFRRVRGTKAPPTSGAQRLVQARPHFYWWSRGACVLCGARVRSVPGRCLPDENGVARRNSRLKVHGRGSRERRKPRGAGTRACAVGCCL